MHNTFLFMKHTFLDYTDVIFKLQMSKTGSYIDKQQRQNIKLTGAYNEPIFLHKLKIFLLYFLASWNRNIFGCGYLWIMFVF